MSCSPRALARDLRYALPGYVGRLTRGPDAASAARSCARMHRRGLASTIGYFQADNGTPQDILAANIAVAALLAGQESGAYLSVKAPPLAFDPAALRTIAGSAAEAGLPLLFDAHAPKDAERTLAAVEELLDEFRGTGCAIPARWRRSLADAGRLRESTARIRIVKGEWPDPAGDEGDPAAAYLALAAKLAGRAAPVAVATHDPDLAQQALRLLRDTGTPCELEQLCGLPSRRTMAAARALGVPIRVYLPFGPGWWPYALDKALARPYLPLWLAKDLLGLK